MRVVVVAPGLGMAYLFLGWERLSPTHSAKQESFSKQAQADTLWPDLPCSAANRRNEVMTHQANETIRMEAMTTRKHVKMSGHE